METKDKYTKPQVRKATHIEALMDTALALSTPEDVANKGGLDNEDGLVQLSKSNSVWDK